MRACLFALGAGAALAAWSMAPRAQAGIIFAVDLNHSDTVPLAPAQRPNSNAAAADFAAQLASMRMTSFEASEGYTANTTFPAPASGPGVNPMLNFGGGLTAQLTGGIIRFQAPGTAGPDVQPDGRYATDGVNYVAQTASVLTLAFSAPQQAVGFWGIDVGDFGGTLTITLSGGVGGTRQMVVNPISQHGENSGSVMFWSFFETGFTFTQVGLGGSSSADVFAYDKITVGTLVPEPGAGFLALVGGGMGARRRRP